MSIKTIEGALRADKARFCLVVSRWNSFVVESLEKGAIDALKRHGADDADLTIVRVPGAFEMPVVIERIAAKGGYDAIVALGAVIRGGTPHFEYVCQAATMGITEVSIRTGVPIGFGVLTCDTEQQALDRAGLPDSDEDKGHEAASAAVATVAALRAVATAWAVPGPPGPGT